MAFTKINAAGIGTTETVTVDGLTVINNESIGGNLTVTGNATISGVLTYEDVTNVDSIGLITARNGIVVGSGITLSKDGDGFFTGIVTATTFTGALTGNATGLSGSPSIACNVVTCVNGTFASDVVVGGNISIPDKIIHTDDTNTAIRFSGSDRVSVETAGTERLAIEPAGNVNMPKSVVVGTAITVGSATSTSTFVGGGYLELTRSSGDTYIDFKNAYADDFDCRIITNAANQLQFFTGGQGSALCAFQTGGGSKVGIATDASPSVAKLQVHSDKLGGTSGNTQELLYLTSPDVSNSTTYRFTNYRHTNGTTHTSSEGRLRRHVDATDMAFFGLGDGYANIGYGTAEKLRVDSSGRLLIGTTSTSGISASGDDIIIGSIGDSTVRGLTFATTANASIRWADAGDNAMGRIQYDNSTDIMQFMTSNAQRMRLDSDGLKFGTDSAAANALDDYEEGDHVPSYNALSTGNVGNNFFKYVKVGGLVHFQGYQSFNSTADGDVIQMSVPFTNSGGNSWCPFTVQTNKTGLTNGIVGRIKENSNMAEFKYMSGDSHLTYSTINGYWLIFGGTFKTTD